MEENIEYFECQYCGTIMKIDQSKYAEKKIVYPIFCNECEGGCGRKSKFLRLSEEYLKERKLQKQ